MSKRSGPKKTYWALVKGVPRAKEGKISTWLIKEATEDGDRMRVAKHGEQGADHAVSYYRVIDQAAQNLAWLELEPYTGRTHQLRVHMDHIGCTMVGDPYYGERNAGEPHLLLHALSIIVPLHDGKPPVEATAPIPAHWPRSWCEALAAASDTRRPRPVT